MTCVPELKNFLRTMVFSIAKLIVCFCLYASFCFKFCVSYQIIQRDSGHNSARTLNSYRSDDYQVKYPNLNKVMARIENLNDEVKTKSNLHRLRHKGWNKYTTTTTTTTTEAGLFENYDDSNEEDYFDSEEEDDNFDYDDDDFSDEDPFDDTFEDIQAEEATEMPTFRRNYEETPISKFTEYKWQHYGTMDRVQQSRTQHLNLRVPKEQSKIQAALDHYARVSGQSKCMRPSPKVISVQQEHPNLSKTYTPHCTVLHRCADDTGCCKRNTKCQFKSRELVHLYFYTSQIGTTDTKVEKLTFYNHTECECKERTENASTERTKDIGYKSANYFPGVTTPMNEERCKCPKRFLKIITHKCICDCGENDEDCMQLKKGKEHFSMKDRMCIQDGECTKPVCEYGSYIVIDGKCPSKKEKFEEFRRIQNF